MINLSKQEILDIIKKGKYFLNSPEFWNNQTQSNLKQLLDSNIIQRADKTDMNLGMGNLDYLYRFPTKEKNEKF